MSKQDNPTIGFVSLGCPKALVDSERIITQLRAEGYGLTNSYDGADLVVINTCGFIDDAIQESMDAIGDAIDENGRVIVTGCLGSRSDEIRERYPQVLDISGAHAYEAVMGAVHKHVPRPHDPYTDLLPPAGIKLTPRHYAYLKISEGCNHRCSFCIIPHLRGDLVSRPIGDVLSEAEQLQEAGVNELLIISQDTSAYGVDLRYRTGFWHGRPVKTRMQELCEALGEMDMWVRLHYVYPYPHVDNIIPLMNEGKILPYLDIPFQHASPRILKAMKRPAHADGTLERIHRWREVCPDLAIRSTFIVGFPGETEQDFQMLLDFLEEAQLDRVGCFTYSPVDGAPANDLPDHVPADVAKARQERLMNLQARISADKLAAKVGTEVAVIIDEIDGDTAVGRTHADAPEIDGNIILRNAGNLSVGEILAARVEHSDEHDLYGVAIDMLEEASA